MLGGNDAIAMIAVKDVKAAAKFYEETLGLARLSTEGDEVVTRKPIRRAY
ncbi:MAG: VOC family protein [Pseudomonadota bacterium]